MAAAVMTPQTISFAREAEIMAPSPLSKTGASPRHGRTKSGARTRGYSIHVISEREAAISKALAKVFRQARAHASEKEDSSSEEEDAVTIDAEGWADCEEVVCHPAASSQIQAFLPPNSTNIFPNTNLHIPSAH